MATNDFIGFASSGSANIISQAAYAAAAEQWVGVQPGMASSKLANKIWRQGANMAAALGRIAAARGYNALDNGDLNALQGAIDDTISVGTFNRMFFSQTSGSYTAPRTGVFRITLKSGGGGGGAAGDGYKSGGGGGGEGGTVTFYKTLTKDQSYAYVIGAGGAAAPNVTDSGEHYGSSGGASSFNGEYSIYGGQGGRNVYGNNRGGTGGQSGFFPGDAVVYITPGQMGQAGALALNTGYGGSPASGGGGGINAFGRGGEGAYFSGGAAVQAADGKDGFILIEYAG